MKILYLIGNYGLLMKQVFRKPCNRNMFWKQFMYEVDVLGIDSLGITAFISIFMGAVIAIQTASNIDNPLTPSYLVGYTTRESMILEFAPTMIGLILAGKVGSRIASEIGTMRVTEQIDALDVMGVNSASYLILPKISACLIINPFLVTLSMILGTFGGWLAMTVTGMVPSDQYISGIRYSFQLYNVFYAIVKTLVFAFIISTISATQGYNTSGGALEVGRASTKAVVYSSILIILFNLILTQLLLG
ncbi:MAG: ABC transporter permease [Bacteroidota bacterium]|nr:ABC transporter permease [Bacteroidota bacterium]